MDVAREVNQAEARIRPYIRQTYLDPSPYFSRLARAHITFKLENLQHTGSFKVRGAFNKLLSLTEVERRRGVVTASTGNHGLALAYSLQRLGITGSVYVPDNASPAKIQAIEHLGATVKRYGTDSVETEVFARKYAAENDLIFVSPYNDPKVIGGQGTIGLELGQQAGDIDAVFVAVGGGGLISGIAGYMKSVTPRVKILGCSPVNSQVMVQSIRAGTILDLPSSPTLSDGTAGGVEPGAITFELCRELVDDFLTVTEAEIREALLSFLETHRMLIEGAAAVPLAACLKAAERFPGGRLVVIVCGANISLDTLKRVISTK